MERKDITKELNDNNIFSSGSGKTTVAKLLIRMFDVKKGKITFGGEDVKSYSQASLRQAMGVVPQDTVLFNDTIKCVVLCRAFDGVLTILCAGTTSNMETWMQQTLRWKRPLFLLTFMTPFSPSQTRWAYSTPIDVFFPFPSCLLSLLSVRLLPRR